MRRFILVLIFLGVLSGITLELRHRLLFSAMASGEVPPLLEPAEEGMDAVWFDDYFLVVPVAADTYAIAEPRYAQQNFSYLILGEDTGILFDAGPGVRDIRPVVNSLTTLPVTFVPSHFHYDHIGNKMTFERVAVIDLPHIRKRAPENKLPLTWEEHLGDAEGFTIPTLTVTRWLQPDEIIDLGGRMLKVLYTPGHTTDSISLLDVQAGLLFSGDFIYPGPLYAFLPNSNLGDYQQATDLVLANSDVRTRILGAHRVAPPGLPELTVGDVQDLQRRLMQLKRGELDGEGIYPRAYTVNENLVLLTEPGWLKNWQPTYP